MLLLLGLASSSINTNNNSRFLRTIFNSQGSKEGENRVNGGRNTYDRVPGRCRNTPSEHLSESQIFVSRIADLPAYSVGLVRLWVFEKVAFNGGCRLDFSYVLRILRRVCDFPKGSQKECR